MLTLAALKCDIFPWVNTLSRTAAYNTHTRGFSDRKSLQGDVWERGRGTRRSFPSRVVLRPRHSDTLSNTRHFTSAASLVPLVLTRHSTQDTLYPTLPRRVFTSASRGGCRGKVAPNPEVFPASKVPSPPNPPAHQPALPPATKPFPVFFQRAPGWCSSMGQVEQAQPTAFKTPPLLRYGGDKQVGEGTLLRQTPQRLRRISTIPRGNMERAEKRRGEERKIKRKHRVSPALFIAPRD